MIDIQESIEENAADQQLRACLPYITEGLGKKIWFLTYQCRATKKKCSLQWGVWRNHSRALHKTSVIRIMENTHNWLHSLSTSALFWGNALWHFKEEIIIWPSRIIFSPDYTITAMTILYFEAGVKETTNKELLNNRPGTTSLPF